MILYNVTINVEEDIHDQWLAWMKREHLPMVMSTGKFLKYAMFRILDRQEDETGITYAIQYFARNMADYRDYQTHHAKALQAETAKLFEGKFVAFRTLLEEDHSYEKP
ncbi:MAG: DUF4286 family protein [Bacteroidota bacterium]|nr:DUF4286 family protein [Bacteroidota bacterium]MDX5430622.1 DUF4286 family protein [Bacteroidota bacterium]MDX5469374.1 DUF4286 family protein [Bacteroidota bacterium]